jgi:hypothetical protein
VSTTCSQTGSETAMDRRILIVSVNGQGSVFDRADVRA